MKKLYLSIALCSCSCVQLANASQDEAQGFFTDASFKGIYKNFYFYRNFLNEPNTKQNYAKEWVHGVMLDFSSGYTPGFVGLGLDMQGFYSQRLDSSKAQAGGGLGLFPYKQGTDPKHSYGRINVATKMRISKTVVKFGNMYPETPVFGTANNRLWPQTSTGLQIISNDINKTTLEVGYFFAKNARTSSGHDGDIGFWNLLAINPYTHKKVRANHVTYAGIVYKPIDKLSITYYGADFKDVYQQHYAELSYAHPITKNITWDGTTNLYRTLAKTNDKAGSINNTTWGIKTGLAYEGHKLTAAFQESHGNQAMPFEGAYPGEYSFKWLVNAAMYNDFDAANEKSAQIRYDYNFANLGMDGLTFSTRYIKGWDANYTHNRTANTASYQGYKYKHHEYNAEFKYIVQTGHAKGLSFNVRYASHRTQSNSPLRDFNEVRVITQYPFDILSIANSL